MSKRFVTDTALYNVQVVVRFLHDPQPRFINSLEPLRLLQRQPAPISLPQLLTQSQLASLASSYTQPHKRCLFAIRLTKIFLGEVTL